MSRRDTMTPAEAREEFAKLLEAHKQRGVEDLAARDALQAEYDAAVVAAAKALRKRSKKNLDDPQIARAVLPEEMVAKIAAPFKERAQAIDDAQRQQREIEREALETLADQAEVRSGDKQLILYTAWSSTYSSQGFGATSYARGAAEQHADVVRFYNIAVDVVEVNACSVESWPNSSMRWADFNVVVHVESELDVEILQRKPGLPLREQVRLCWKRGVNPRVYNPYLPAGYEEKVGLDYHGGEVKR